MKAGSIGKVVENGSKLVCGEAGTDYHGGVAPFFQIA